MSQKIEKFEARIIAVHGHGNPQLTLQPFIGKITHTCYRCEGKFPQLTRVEFISGLKANVCKTCLETYQQKTTIKKILGIIH